MTATAPGALRKLRHAGRRLRWRLLESLRPRQTVHARGVSFTLACDNWITQFRLDSFATKEPDTLDWIDSHVRADDVLFDVGGNIGVYTLYAALRHPGCSVVVFEPEFSNLHLLRDNIVANGLSGRVQVYPIALSDRTGITRLHVQDLTPGAALHSESAERRETTESGERVVMSEGACAMRLDDFCAEAELWPSVLKLDVDGTEARVLAGATATLSRSGFRSLIVEAVDAGFDAGARQLLVNAGLRAATAGHAAAVNEVWIR